MKTRTRILLTLIVLLSLFSAVVASGTSPGAAPNFLIFVEARFDSGLGGAVSVAVSPGGSHVYVAGNDDDAVAIFSRNGSTGALSYEEMVQDGDGGTVDGLDAARSVAISPDGSHVYVAGYFDDAVAIFDRNSSTGALSFTGVVKDGDGGIVDGLNGPQTLAVSPDGGHVYVASNDEDAVAVFDRNGSSGALTFRQVLKDGDGGVVDGLDGAYWVAFGPDGSHVYVAGYVDDAVVVFSRNASTGALTFREVVKDGDGGVVDGLDGANAIALSPDGRHVYVAGRNDNALAIFSRNGSTGALSYEGMVQDGVNDVDGLYGARAVAVSPDGYHVYAVGQWDNAVAVFERDGSTGALTFMEMLPDDVGGVDGLNVADGVAVSPDSKHIYVAGYGDDALAVFRRQFVLFLPLILSNYTAPYLVKDINAAGDSSPDQLTDVNGTLFFVADDGAHGVELWKSDGTTTGTKMVKDINSVGDAFPQELTDVNGTLFFIADDGTHGVELWKSDGTTAGTKMVKDIHATGDAYPWNLANVNGTLFFAADDGTRGEELWKSDGTAGGTLLVKDINPTDGSYPAALTNVNGTLFFGADDGSSGDELWKSDGTAAGTVLVKDINPTSFSNPTRLVDVDGTLFFVADDGTHGIELWKSNGTAAGTTMVKEINAADDYYPEGLTNVNGTLFFIADDGTHGEEVWKSDGTTAGTKLLKDINTTGASSPVWLTNVNGMLFFAADDGVNGTELWKSDGTTAGTKMVKDIRSTGGSGPDWLAAANDTLFFAASDGVVGRELWQSDGSTSGTTLVKDINTAPSIGSFPIHLISVNGTLFFRADDGTTGRELWAMGLNR